MMGMDLNQLHTFTRVAQLESFSRAAEQLFVTQPAVSNQIRALEDELGCRLFDRHHRRIYLTESGRVLLAYCRDIFSKLDESRKALQDVREGPPQGPVVIGAFSTAGTYILAEPLKALRTEFPLVQFGMRYHSPERLVNAVTQNEVDFAISVTPPEDPAFRVIALFEEPFYLVGSPEFRLPQRVDNVAELAGCDFLLPEATDNFRNRWIDPLFAKYGVAPRIALEVNTLETLKKMAEIGFGLAILPAHSVREELVQGRLQRVDLQLFSQTVALFHLKAKYLSKAAEIAIDRIQSSPTPKF